MAIVAESRKLADELGVLDANVFFNDAWVEYADRQNYLLEADIGVSTHRAHIETTFSFRTRILDYLWAGLPMVVTAGDHFAELIEREELGRVVPAGDVAALADAIEETLFDAAFRERVMRNVQQVAQRYTWPVVLAPLIHFVNDPKPAADRADPAARERARRQRLERRSGFRHDVGLVVSHLRTSGLRIVVEKVWKRLMRR